MAAQGQAPVEFGNGDCHTAKFSREPFRSEHNEFAGSRDSFGEAPAVRGEDAGDAIDLRGDSGEQAGFGGVRMNQVRPEAADGPREFTDSSQIFQRVQGHNQMAERHHGDTERSCLIHQKAMLFGC